MGKSKLVNNLSFNISRPALDCLKSWCFPRYLHITTRSRLILTLTSFFKLQVKYSYRPTEQRTSLFDMRIRDEMVNVSIALIYSNIFPFYLYILSNKKGNKCLQFDGTFQRKIRLLFSGTKGVIIHSLWNIS